MTLFGYVLARCSRADSQNGSESTRVSSSSYHDWKAKEDIRNVCLGSGGMSRRLQERGKRTTWNREVVLTNCRGRKGPGQLSRLQTRERQGAVSLVPR